MIGQVSIVLVSVTVSSAVGRSVDVINFRPYIMYHYGRMWYVGTREIYVSICGCEQLVQQICDD